jgi:uncharacterized protein involved in tolerance to divalent cations
MVMTTCATDGDAERIAGVLLEGRLAACVQILPIDSRYVWKGRIERGAEFLLLIKCAASNFGAVRDAILASHAYELPEIVQVPITDGSERCLAWIKDPFAGADA